MLRRARPLLLPALSLLLAVAGGRAAQAGTVYVPLPGIGTVGTATWEEELTIGNPSVQGAPVSALLLGNDTDGTVRGAATPYTVAAGKSMLLNPAPGSSYKGLAELAGSPNARYAARLVGKGVVGQGGVALPVVTSEEVVSGAATVTLQGLASSATRAVTVVLFNAAKQPSQCTLTLVRYDGSAVLGSPQTVAMKALSQQVLANVFGGDSTAAVDARAAVTCTREFYAYALQTDSVTGEIGVVRPSGSGESTLTRPGEEPACPTGAACSSWLQTFKPTPATPVGHVVFPAPAMVAKRLVLSLDVTVDGFYAGQPDGKHLVYWWVINKNFDMPGMLYFRGPEASTALARWGIGLKHEQKKKHAEPFVAIPGHTYHVVNEVDMGAGVFRITITDVATGQVVQTILDTPNVGQVTLKSTDRFLVDMGFKEGAVPDEVPSFGWTYTNVRLQVIP